LLHVRAASETRQTAQLEAELYDRRYLNPRAVLRAFETSPSVLLIDEVDRADDEFEALLLEALSEFSLTIPELGTIRPAVPPFVVLTSNRTREVHDALKRRCIYQWIEHPSREREIAILMRSIPALPAELASDVAEATRRLRQKDLLKPPGVAESLDWAASLLELGAERLSPEKAEVTLGAVLKYHEDQERVRRDNLAALCGQGGE
jgi:MoxR-like ATPase